MRQSCDVLLIAPPPFEAGQVASLKSVSRRGYIPPLGLGYLAAVLEQEGYKVSLLDMLAEGVRGTELFRLVRDLRPRMVGLTTMVVSYKNAMRVARLVKEASPDTMVVIGGPQATFLVEETLAHPSIDVVVQYEGEDTIIELMRYLDEDNPSLSEIRGIAFRDGVRIFQTESRAPIEDLDRLPFPARHLFKASLYTKPGILITARGCPSRCVFCAANALYPEHRYRARSPEKVVDEIVELTERFGVGEFFIADDAFTLQPKRAIEICDLMIRRGVRAKWTCEARVDTMTPELIRKMREAGCYLVQYGVETGDPEIMRLIRKGISLEQVEETVYLSQVAGLDVICSFIIGFPWDTRETVLKTIEFARRLCRMGATIPNRGGSGRGLVSAMFAYLTPLPGTYLYEHAEELGMRILSRDWNRFTFSSPITETDSLNAVEMRELFIEATRLSLNPL